MEGKDIMAKATEMEAITANTNRDQSQHVTIFSMRKVQNITLKCKAELFSMKAKLDNIHIFHRSEQNGINETNSGSTVHLKIISINVKGKISQRKTNQTDPTFLLSNTP